MAETLGSLCDKLTIVKLKQWHSEDKAQLEELAFQEKQLQSDIDEFITAAISGYIPLERLTFNSNKVYNKSKNFVHDIEGSIGGIISHLAYINCKLWHEQEKVYDFEKVRASEKDKVVKQIASLNLERNKCIDEIDKQLKLLIESK